MTQAATALASRPRIRATTSPYSNFLPSKDNRSTAPKSPQNIVQPSSYIDIIILPPELPVTVGYSQSK